MHRDRILTYGELDRRSDLVADHLVEQGVGPEVLVGLCMEPSERLLIAMLAIMKCGGAYVPLEPEGPEERLRHMLFDSKPPLVVSDARHKERFAGFALTVIVADEALERPRFPHRARRQSDLQPDHLAYVMFTSGSTGRPKGVMVTHGALGGFLASMAERLGIGASDTIVAVTPLTFDIAVLELVLPLLGGGKVVIADRIAARDGEALQRLLAESGATVLQATPATWRLLLAAGWQPRAGLRMLCGGEALTADLAGALGGPGTVLWNLYGPTEATIWATAARVEPGRLVSLGEPVRDAAIHVLDERLSPCTRGEAGEIYIGGGCVARGYAGRPDLTAARFLPDPFSAGGRLYRTGDLARVRTDGSIEFAGRADRQIKLRGYRIELDEVEAVLEAQPNVEQAAVNLCDADTDAARLIAYVTPDRRRLRSSEVYARARAEAVDLWQTVFDDTYAAETGAKGPRFTGLNSSYRREPLPLPEQQEWLRSTVERIGAARLGHVLEIGCGQGLLLQQLAPRSASYRAADPSLEAIAALGQWIKQQPHMRHVELLHRPASRLDDFDHASIDTIILNSVIQYFPDIAYLVEVLERAAPLLAPGGRLFIGDVRHLGLLRLFHASVQLHKAPPGLTVREIREHCARAMAAEAELAIDPSFFGAFSPLLKGLGGARILLKRGLSDNEMTRYRYDVVLCAADRRRAPAPTLLEWHPEGTWADELDDMLARGVSGNVEIRGVPNRRLVRDIEACKILEASDERRRVRDLRREVAALRPVGGDPTAFYELGERHGYEVSVGWTPRCPEGRFDVRFSHFPQGAAPSIATGACGPSRGDWEGFATNPTLNAIARGMGPALRQSLKRSLPDYMIPAAVVVLDRMPISANGKTDRKVLSELKPPGRNAGALETPVEKALAAIWCELLRLGQIERDDNFLSLGGHSLLAMQMMSRIRATCGVEVPMRTVFELPTLRQMAARIEHLQEAGDGCTPPLARPRSAGLTVPLSYAQEEIWVVEQLGVTGPAYNMPLAIHLTGMLVRRALSKALDQLLMRHEILRTRIVTADGRPCQQVERLADIQIDFADLSSLADAHRQERRRDIVDTLSRHAFDLSSAPLLRACAITLGDRDHLVVLVLHHIISDEWSNHVLVGELSALYSALARDEPPQLPPPPSQYADHAISQREGGLPADHERRIAYWKGKLRGAPRCAGLPPDFARPAVQCYAGGNVRFVLPWHVCASLKALARRENATLFMVLMAGFNWLLARRSGQEDIVIGTPSACRDNVEAETCLGLFVNAVPIRTEIRGATSFLELLRSVRANSMEAYANVLPFSLVVDALRPARSPAFQPLFQVWMAMQTAPSRDERLDGTAMRWRNLETASAKFDLSLHLYEEEGGVEGEFEYSSTLYARETIEALSDEFIRLLETVASDAELPLSLAPGRRVPPTSLEIEPLPRAPARPGDTAPAWAAERAILEVWREVLRIPAAGPLDSFFDLGGSSLDLVAVRDRLERRLRRPIQLVQLFMHPTARALAAHLGGAEGGGGRADDVRQRALRQRRAMAQRRPIAAGGGER